LSRDLQLNCVISFFFRLHLVLYACTVRFDVTGTVALFGFTFCELNRLLYESAQGIDRNRKARTMQAGRTGSPNSIHPGPIICSAAVQVQLAPHALIDDDDGLVWVC
jgi:hypothetical protein